MAWPVRGCAVSEFRPWTDRHTPGPWTVKRGQVQAETSQGYVIIGLAPGWSLKEQQANLRLIAAAPELLEALKSALSVLQLWVDDPDDEEMLERLPALIAKAEGRS